MDFKCCSSVLCSILIPLLLLLLIGHRKKNLTKNLPPGPRKLPLVGNLHQFGSLPHRSIERLSQQYGPIMFLQLGSIPTLVISSGDVAREIFRNLDRVFSGRPILYAASKFTYNCSNISYAPYGDHWRELRKIATLELLTTKRVQSFQTVREDEVKYMLDNIAAGGGGGGDGSGSSPVNLTDSLVLLTNNVICRTAFGKRCSVEGSGRSEFQEAIHELQHSLGGFCITDLFPWMSWFNKLNGFESKINKTFWELDRLYDEIIAEHKDSKRPKPEHEDLVDMLVRLQKDSNQEITMTDDHVKGLLTDVFNAGTDTSATTLVWTMTELIRNPEIMKAAQDEVREAVKGKFMVEEIDLSKLVYLKAVIKESLRLHPPLPLSLPRETIEDCEMNGYHIPAKTKVIVNAFAISTDPKYWDNPGKFLPERFLNSSIDYKGQNFEFIPFGAGRRGCPGIHFAAPVIELGLANLLHRFNWKLPQGMKIEDVDMAENVGLTTHKKAPLYLVPTQVNR